MSTILWYSLCMSVLFSLKYQVTSIFCIYFTFDCHFGQEQNYIFLSN